MTPVRLTHIAFNPQPMENSAFNPETKRGEFLETRSFSVRKTFGKRKKIPIPEKTRVISLSNFKLLIGSFRD